MHSVESMEEEKKANLKKKNVEQSISPTSENLMTMEESYVNDWLTVCSPDTLIVGEVLIVSLTHHQLKQSA